MIYFNGFLISPSWRLIPWKWKYEPVVNDDQTGENCDSVVDDDGIEECGSRNGMSLTQMAAEMEHHYQNGDDGVTKKEDSVLTIANICVRNVALFALQFCPFWILANWTFNESLSRTSVSSNTILSSTSGLFTFFFALCILRDRFSWQKLSGVGITFAGIAFIASADESGGGQSTLIGDALALASAVFYGLYTIFLRWRIPDEERIHMPMFFAFVGCLNVLLFWPIFCILDWFGLESFELPSSTVLMWLLLNGIIGTVLSDLLWSLAVLWTTPLIATVGLSLTIPLAMLSDVLIRSKTFTILYLIGSILVLVGFLVVNLTPQTEEKQQGPGEDDVIGE
jgi:solute carrier family 35, member F5